MALAGTAACSGSGSDSAASSTGAGSGSPSASASGSSAPLMEVGASINAAVLIAKVNAAAKRARSFHIEQVADVGASMKGDINLTTPPTGHFWVTESGTQVEALVIGDRAYAAIAKQVLPAGKKWMLARWGGKDDMSQGMAFLIYLTKLDGPISMTPGEQKALTLTRTDDDQVHGVTCQVYTYQETKAQQLAAVAALPAVAQASAKQDIYGDITGRIFLDAAGLPRRFETSFEKDGQLTKFTTDYSNWGKAVVVSTPKAATVLDPTKLK